MLPTEHFPHDKDELIREIDARMRIGDIRRSHDLKARLAPKWWETGFVVLLFVSALGLLASLFQYAEIRDSPLNAWLLFWFALTILTVVMTFEFLLVKIYNLRRSNEVMLRMMDDLRDRTEEMEQKVQKANEERKAEPSLKQGT